MTDDVRTRARLDLAGRWCFEEHDAWRSRPLPPEIAAESERVDGFLDRHHDFIKRNRKVIFGVLDFLSSPWPGLARSGLQGRMWGCIERGEHADALRVALLGCERSLTDKRGSTPDDPHHDYWTFMEGAVAAAGALGDAASWGQAWWAASRPFLPIEGFEAAASMLALSGWRESCGHRNDAIRMARLSLGADPTWPESSIWAARLGLRGAPFDVERMLRDAIAIDARAKQTIYADVEFAAVPGLLARLERPRLRVPRVEK